MTDWLNVLVFADGSTEGVARALSAREICLTSPASRLTVRVPVLSPVRAYGYTVGAVEGAMHERQAFALSAAESDVSRLHAALDALALGDRVSVSPLCVEAAAASRIAASLGRYADLVVVGQPSATAAPLESFLLQGALIGSGRPCLVLPDAASPRRLGGRAVIAWKGTPEAARAVRDALPLLKKAERVRIFAASDELQEEGEGSDGLARLAHYLGTHGVIVEPPVLTAPPDEIISTAGGAILAEVEGFGADLLVMGGYGHSRFQEFIFGGATRSLIGSCAVPLLLSH